MATGFPGKRLLVLGAGPKGVAIAAKRAVMAERGWSVPELRLVDRAGVGGHWTGSHGYTDGGHLLGTPPEKDIGFPYASDVWGVDSAAVDEAMLHYSWQAYLVKTRDPRLPYAAWVDRGRVHPPHRRWAEYMAWVARMASADVAVEQVDRIDLADGRWRAEMASGLIEECDGLVLTGPGPPRRDVCVSGASDRVLNGSNFWRRSDLERDFSRSPSVCVIGSGETAAAIVVQFVRKLPDCLVDIVSRQGIVYSRGESFEENHFYSAPDRWAELGPEKRREFIGRTDRGVFSVATKAALNEALDVRTVAGHVDKIVPRKNQVAVHFSKRELPTLYDVVVDATGFDVCWFLSLFTHTARAALDRALGTSAAAASIEDALGPDLAVQNLSPRLHVPALAGMKQGPGFANLSSLGLLADRVLGRYCRAPSRGPRTP